MMHATWWTVTHLGCGTIGGKATLAERSSRRVGIALLPLGVRRHHLIPAVVLRGTANTRMDGAAGLEHRVLLGYRRVLPQIILCRRLALVIGYAMSNHVAGCVRQGCMNSRRIVHDQHPRVCGCATQAPSAHQLGQHRSPTWALIRRPKVILVTLVCHGCSTLGPLVQARSDLTAQVR